MANLLGEGVFGTERTFSSEAGILIASPGEAMPNGQDATTPPIEEERWRTDREGARGFDEQDSRATEERRVVNEASRSEAERTRRIAEEARQHREQDREALDHVREERESARQAAEAARAAAEQARSAAEDARHAAEAARHATEQARTAAEEARHATVESVRATADALAANLEQMKFVEDLRRMYRDLADKKKRIYDQDLISLLADKAVGAAA